MAGRPGSRRTAPLPPNWLQLRAQVLARDGYRCVWVDDTSGLRCPQRATDVDHIGKNEDHSMANLRSLCRGHHAARTARQAGRASAAKRKQLKIDEEKHPRNL